MIRIVIGIAITLYVLVQAVRCLIEEVRHALRFRKK